MVGKPVITRSALDHPSIRYLRENVIGRDSCIDTPFGRKRRIYLDYIASGLPFGPVEELITSQVLPWMANTHSEGNASSHRMTSFLEDARRTVAESLGVRDDDAVIFTGSGSTGAINHLIMAMGLRVPDQIAKACGCRSKVPPEFRPMVFRSRMEHHSNDIAWRETLGDTRFVGFDRQGRIDWRDLERQLALPEVRERRLLIGTFSAASNVTGIVNDVDALAETMHAGGGLVFFDYAAAAPYLHVDLHPPGGEGRRKDAVFISTHKFIGGPQTPGILAARRSLFSSEVPVVSGGGTVLYTSPWDHRYLPELESREEGGTPPIVQIIRAGLVFRLKQEVGADLLERAEQELVDRAMRRFAANPAIGLLGSTRARRLGVFSFVLDGGRLHHKLAVRLLNDLHGIQARSGCMCAGTYGHHLLGIGKEASKSIRSALDHGGIWSKPGWTRISVSPLTDPEDLDLALDAIDSISTGYCDYEGLYERDESGEYVWAGGGFLEEPPRLELSI